MAAAPAALLLSLFAALFWLVALTAESAEAEVDVGSFGVLFEGEVRTGPAADAAGDGAAAEGAVISVPLVGFKPGGTIHAKDSVQVLSPLSQNQNSLFACVRSAA